MVCRFWPISSEHLIKKSVIFVFTGLLIGAFLGGVILLSSKTSNKGPVIGSKVDDFTLPGIGTNAISLSQFRGKIIVLNFWATWCIPCKKEMPLLEGIYQTLGDNLVVIGVNAQESESEIRNFIDQNQITFPIVVDTSGELARKFLINGYPTTFFLDSAGILRNLHIGEMREDILRGYLVELGVQQ